MGIGFGYGPAGDKLEMKVVILATIESSITFFIPVDIFGLSGTMYSLVKYSLPSVVKR